MIMKNLQKPFLIKLAAVTLAGIVVFNFTLAVGIFGKVLDVLQPVFIGIVAALIMNVPMEFFEKKVFKKIKKNKIKRFLSLTVTLILFAGIFALIFGLAIPAAAESIRGIYESMNGNYWDKLASENKIFDFIITQFEVLYENFIGKLNDYVPKMLEIATNVVKTVANVILGLGVALMLLAGKHGLKVQLKKFINGVCKNKEKIKKIFSTADIALTKFSRYLGGQVIEAVILGVVCYLCMLLLKLPYAALVSLIIGFVNLIPIVGAYIGGAISAILIFSVSPTKALIFIIFVIILQQVESFTTYPIIVGKYVGLSGFWIMVSIIVWGGLFGFWGVFLGVPLTAFLHDYINIWLQQKKEVPLLPGKTGSE